jgi:hypothetical protein
MSDNHSIERLNIQIDRESFRQSRILFYSYTALFAISTSIALLGIGEIYIGNPQGTKTVWIGLSASINAGKMMRSASDRFKKIADKS